MKKFLGMLLSLMMIVGATAAMAEFDYTQDITVVSREDGSGTRGAFIELLGVEKEDENGEKVDYTTEEAVITNSTNVMMTTVAGINYWNSGFLGGYKRCTFLWMTHSTDICVTGNNPDRIRNTFTFGCGRTTRIGKT